MKPGKSLSTKIILMVEAILLFSSAIFCGISISRAQSGIRRAIRQRMVDIVSCAAGSVNGDILRELKAGDEDTPGFRAVYDSMAVFRDNAELEYIYAIRDGGNGHFTFTVDTDPDEPGAFGDEVHYTEALARAAKGITSVDEMPYSDQWGQFYSAYSPVFDSAGQVAGIVAADFSVAWYDAQLQEQTMSNIRGYIIVLGATLLGAAVLCLLTVRPYVRLQEQLLEEKVTAESASQAKSEFLASMSHEIRTPINAMLGMNELIRRESMNGRGLPAGQEAEARKAFEQIGSFTDEAERAGRSLLALINDILDFSRIEAGRMELAEKPYRLSAMLRDLESMALYRAREKGLEFIADTAEPLPENLFGDEVRVREILSNILTNAVKYTANGFVRFTARAGESTGDEVQLIFTVEDSGIGIRQEDMDKLFSKFQRLDMERNSTVEGSGLGLVITKNLLDMMGGSVRVESEYGKGSVFTVTIPQRIAADESPENAPAEGPEAAAPAGGGDGFRAPEARILIVDDTKMNLTVTVSLLKRTGMQIDTAPGGAEAALLAGERPYDVILMDQRMPGMDGTETLRRIRQQTGGPNSDTPVICLTADAILGARERYLAEGFTDYLAKPVDSRALEEMLLKYLPKEKIEAAVPSRPEAAVPDGRQAADAGDDPCGPMRKAGIDPETGLLYCQGDRELYRTLLTEYCMEYPAKSEGIRDSFDARNWKDYGILVHALKSTSRMLGILDLSGMAARLEAAAHEENTAEILQTHGTMMERYETVYRAIREAVRMPEAEGGPERGTPARSTDPKAAADAEVLEFSPEADDRTDAEILEFNPE